LDLKITILPNEGIFLFSRVDVFQKGFFLFLLEFI
jgi:hypothetical protein